jgi:hypothetical protein
MNPTAASKPFGMVSALPAAPANRWAARLIEAIRRHSCQLMSKSPQMDFSGGKGLAWNWRNMHNANPGLTLVMISGPASHPSRMPLP